MHVFLVHGAYGGPEENWFPWLKVELEKRGRIVHAPSFPTPQGQTLERWRQAFRPYERFLTEDVAFVGHSVGCAFILDLLERHRARMALLASPTWTLLGNRFDRVNRTFVERTFDWEAIRRNCPSFCAFHGSDDPYVPLARARELAERLGASLRVIERGGHLNEKAGFPEFPALLEALSEPPYRT